MTKYKVGIVGLGLIGGSIGMALKRYKKYEIYGMDIDFNAVILGIEMQAIDRILQDEVFAELDMLIFATYADVTVNIIEEYLSKLKPNTIVFDCGGTKRKVVEKMITIEKKYSNLVLYGGHPMAGREFCGIANCVNSLYDGATMLLVCPNSRYKKLGELERVLTDIGFGKIIRTKADIHDAMISYTSQLAHIVSSAYMKNDKAKHFKNFSAGSFRDLTRVAGLNADMWVRLMMENKDNLLKDIDKMMFELAKYRESIDCGSTEILKELFEQGNVIKKEIDEINKIE